MLGVSAGSLPINRKLIPVQFVHGSRLAFLFVLLALSVIGQALQSQYDLRSAFQPIYITLFVSFVMQFFFFVSFERLQSSSKIPFYLFLIEALFIGVLAYLFGVQRSLFLLLFLVNILFCGILFGAKEALVSAAVSSICYAMALALDPSINAITFLGGLTLSQIAFFTVAFYSGFFRDQLVQVGAELSERIQALRDLKDLNRVILTHMNGGLLTMELSGEVIQSNRKAEEFFHHLAGLEGRNITNLFPGLSFADVDLKTGKSFTLPFEVSGETLFLRLHLAKIETSEGSMGYILNFHDETPMYRLERRVRQSEKLAAVGQLAAGIAHEIRNPLASMSGSVQLLRADLATGEEKKKLMTIIDREINRLNGLITEFLDYARPEAPKTDEVNLGTLMDQIMDMMKFQFADSKIEQHRDLQSNLVLLGNHDKLKQAFLNIIVNAYQAMGEQAQGQVTVTAKKSEGGALISIEDTGSGIEKKNLDRIFEPFLTTKQNGTGLGLAITHSIFESHGASVEVKSRVGVGTEFHITFPDKCLL